MNALSQNIKQQKSTSSCAPIIFKFGGSSLANAKCFNRVANIIKQKLQPNDWVVVSASDSTTDWLLKLCQKAGPNNRFHKEQQNELIEKLYLHHKAIIEGCLVGISKQQCLNQIHNDINAIKRTIDSNTPYENINDIIALGELWSAFILVALLQQLNLKANNVDARQCLKMSVTSSSHKVDFALSKILIEQKSDECRNSILVFTGFIASDQNEQTQLLGRNGSDLSATILAKLIGARSITLWTDVAGIYNFDPNLSSKAKPFKHLNREIVHNLSLLGSPVIHSKTLAPIDDLPCDLSIRSTFAPELLGSKITQGASKTNQTIVTHKNELTQFQLSLRNGFDLKQLLNQLDNYRHTLTGEFFLITQSSKTKLALLVDSTISSDVDSLLHINQHTLSNQTIKKVSLIGLITNNISNAYYHQQFIQQFINNHNANLVSCELLKNHQSVICLFESKNINAIALQFFEQWHTYQKQTAVFLIGQGNIGSTWCEQVKHLTHPYDQFHIGLKANSRQIQLFLNDEQQAFKQLTNSQEKLINIIAHAPFKTKIVIDVTASKLISDSYSQFFDAGCHVISANKEGGASNEFERIDQAAFNNRVLWLQNATLGAGLPINHALTDLLQCGDQIKEVKGVFSGTLSWLLNHYDGSIGLSQLIKKALELGLCEPDPRIDLSGSDVARKLIIVARLAGIKLESEVSINSLIDKKFLTGDLSQFWRNSKEFDQAFHSTWIAAQQQQRQLVYQASVNECGIASCGLIALPQSEPLTQLSPCDNVFQVTSKWYQNNPLIIRGPGAGKEVTAAAVQSDLNHLLKLKRPA